MKYTNIDIEFEYGTTMWSSDMIWSNNDIDNILLEEDKKMENYDISNKIYNANDEEELIEKITNETGWNIKSIWYTIIEEDDEAPFGCWN